MTMVLFVISRYPEQSWSPCKQRINCIMYFRATEVILKTSTCSLTRRPDFDQILIMKSEYAVCVSFTINTPTGISANSLSFMDRDSIYLDKNQYARGEMFCRRHSSGKTIRIQALKQQQKEDTSNHSTSFLHMSSFQLS